MLKGFFFGRYVPIDCVVLKRLRNAFFDQM